MDTIVDIDAAGSLGGFASALLESEEQWNLARLILPYQPAPALGRIGVPLLAVFGADDPIVPVEASIEALRAEVDSELLTVAVFDTAGHRLEMPNGTLFVDGYLDAVVRFANRCATT